MGLVGRIFLVIWDNIYNLGDRKRKIWFGGYDVIRLIMEDIWIYLFLF